LHHCNPKKLFWLHTSYNL